MKKTLFCLIVGLCCISRCLAQHGWVVPKLEELTQADSIKSGRAHLSAEETTLLKQVTREIINKCVKYPGPYDPKTPAEFFGQLRAQRVALTPHGDSGLVVQGFGSCMCGAVGNCSFWIIGASPHRRVLLEGDGIQTFAFQATQSDGYFDLFLGAHYSAMRTDLERFRFDGTKYRRNGCATIEWADEIDNKLPHPRITPKPCS